MDKGGVIIEDTLLFGKYHLHQILGTGRSGTVFLAVHKELEEYRAIKRVSKTYTDYQRFRQEALVLKKLRHPGIPIVYDVEEDEEYSYLIEEYLEGESLFSLVTRLGPLTKAMTIRYGIQICHLVFTLHSATPNPILYLDLQPKNLLLCQDVIKLVDFDHAASICQANSAQKRYGTCGWAAPEQYDPEAVLKEQTDIYAIGAVLYYMLTGNPPDKKPQYRVSQFGACLCRILRKCLQDKPERRYNSAKELSRDLTRLQNSLPGVFTNQSLSSLRLAVIGSKAGIGTTHLAICLSNYLRRNGHPNLYEEHNESQAVSALSGCFRAPRDSWGLIHIKGCVFKPSYGETVHLEAPPYSKVILDFGTDWEGALMENTDGLILVCDGKWWNWQKNYQALNAVRRHKNLCLVFNHCSSSISMPRPEGMNRSGCFGFPWCSDPFTHRSRVDSCCKAILKYLTKEKSEQKRT